MLAPYARVGYPLPLPVYPNFHDTTQSALFRASAPCPFLILAGALLRIMLLSYTRAMIRFLNCGGLSRMLYCTAKYSTVPSEAHRKNIDNSQGQQITLLAKETTNSYQMRHLATLVGGTSFGFYRLKIPTFS